MKRIGIIALLMGVALSGCASSRSFDASKADGTPLEIGKKSIQEAGFRVYEEKSRDKRYEVVGEKHHDWAGTRCWDETARMDIYAGDLQHEYKVNCTAAIYLSKTPIPNLE